MGIAQGETERKGYIADLAFAQSEYDDATKVHDAAVETHVLAMGALQRAKDELKAATEEKTLRIDNKAVAAFDAADKDLKAKQETLEKESARIQSEELDLDRINELLQQLD